MAQIIEKDGAVCIQLDSGELWQEAGKPRVFKDWQAAQREFAEGRVPAANAKAKDVKHD